MHFFQQVNFLNYGFFQTQLISDINNRYRDLKSLVQKDIEAKQGAIITEKAVKDEANRMMKWLEATKGKLKHSPLEKKSGKIESDLKNAEVAFLASF